MSNLHLANKYRFAGVHCGIKDSKKRDLALIVSDVPASAAGVFTQNRVRAAPVRISEKRLPRADARGVIINAGNANACTGEQGMKDAQHMTELTANVVGCETEQIVVCSTGVIGHHLPMSKIESGIPLVKDLLSDTEEGLKHAAQAITTTDTRIKLATRELTLHDTTIRLTGLAKGAAMIGPNMATMLAFVCTDATIKPEDLQTLTRRSAAQSFNCARVEGHTSTNDTLLTFANGQDEPLQAGDLAHFGSSLHDVCEELARAIIADAEGADHLITIDVEGLAEESDAVKVARAVADSALVKTAIFGNDPNWGRIVSAAGYAGVNFDEHHLSLWLGDLLLYHEGTPQPYDEATASAYLKNNREVTLRLRFTLGHASCRMWTSDLTYEYVKLNAEYTT